jgi:hypothetical protein
MRLIPQKAGQSLKILPETRWIPVRTKWSPWYPLGIYDTETVLNLKEERPGIFILEPPS